ncbi:sulfotransferase domain-containing protein [Formosa undariae]|uniref:Sulfotransferase domain-containing protein n=1 Tax=Formosa undariae TaxID=1325436 RepID=A0ABV5F0A0_9FLAO
MTKPQVFHIGIPKSGTTTLQNILNNDDRLFVSRSSVFTTKDWWFKGSALNTSTDKIVIESNETIISGGFNKVKFIQVVERLYRTNKNAQVVVTIREQRSALNSMFKYHIKNNYEGVESFQNWLYNSNLGMDYISLCMYSNIAKTLLAYFPKEQIHFLFFEELKINPILFYEKIYAIIGIPLHSRNIDSEARNVMGYNADQLYTLACINKYSFTKAKNSGYGYFKGLRSLENKLKFAFVKRFYLKCNIDFFSIDKVGNIQNVYDDFKYNNQILIDLGFVTEDEINKYNYLR